MNESEVPKKPKPSDLSFIELETGFSLRQAIAEAKRCLNCANPVCRNGCPINNKIPDFINELAKGNLGQAYEILTRKSSLPAVCGRVCPRELQCEAHCILSTKNRSIKIGKLERFIADFAFEMGLLPKKIKRQKDIIGRVAIIGSGPAGITVAGDLVKMGFAVTVYESQPESGGVLMYGIPSYRLPKIVVRREIERLTVLGVEFINQVMIGPDLVIDDMFSMDFDAIFIGTGTALPKKLEIPGHDLHNIIPAIYYLRTLALSDAGMLKTDEFSFADDVRVVVIGGGNVALDAARSLRKRKKNSRITVIFQEKRQEMPALTSEVEKALQEGIVLREALTPVRFEGDTFVNKVVAKDTNGHILELSTDVVMLAIGQRPASRIVSTTKGITTDQHGFVVIKDRPYGMTTRQGVFAAGDVVSGPGTVVVAMREAKKVAAGIASYIEAKKLLSE